MTVKELRDYYISESGEPVIQNLVVKYINKDLLYEKEIPSPAYVEWLENKFIDLVTP